MTKKNLILILFILLKFALQYFAIDPIYELHRDEYLHLDLGKHLAWGYLSVPPVTGIISFIIHLLGNSVFWIKFFPSLFGAAIIVVVWKTVEELNGGWFALILAATGTIFSVFIRINTLYQPNSLDYLVWTTLFYIFIKYINTEKNKWLYYAGVVFAIGFLNKYNVVFLLLGLAPALMVTPYRKIFINRHFYLAIVMAFLLISPNLLWQYNNNFPVVHHLKLLAESQLVNVNRLDFLTEQLFFFTGSMIVIFAAFISFFSYEPFKKYRVFFFTFVFTIALFVYLRAKNYYSIGLYPVFLAFGAVYFEKLLKTGWLRILRIPLILLPAIIFIPLFSIILPVLSPEQILQKKDVFDKFSLTRWEDGKLHKLPQDFADMLGWKELASLVDSAFLLVDDKNQTIIHCDNYGQAGAINFYSNQPYTEAVTMNADYINWYPLDKFEIVNVIMVKERFDEDETREREKAFFENVTLIGKIKNEYAREVGTRVYLLKGAKLSINKILREEIADRKKNY
jgi:4-amino-4-deoxy-L-arabinose transferase-like glycosyltransferase